MNGWLAPQGVTWSNCALRSSRSPPLKQVASTSGNERLTSRPAQEVGPAGENGATTAWPPGATREVAILTYADWSPGVVRE